MAGRPFTTPLAPLTAFALLAALIAAAAAAVEVSGELRLRLDPLWANPQSPTVLAQQPSARSEAALEATLRLRIDMLVVDAQLRESTTRQGDTASTGRINELYLSAPFGGLQLSGGRRVVQWDVGASFRPNDLVEQDQSRLLLATQPQGRTVLQVERFGTELSAALVWVNPQNSWADNAARRFGEEAALAAMGYLREGSTDLYGFARVGEHTGLSLGAAALGVVGDSLSVYASARALQRHDGWASPLDASTAIVGANPWQQATLGRTTQALVGASWTGESRQGAIVEYWLDGTTLSDAQWNAWLARTDALAAQNRSAPGQAVAGNLAWQGAPLAVPNQRRQTLFVRLSWQPEPWLLTLDTLFNPADAGSITTAGLQWQGDRVRVNAALRWLGGPRSSLAMRLPERRSGLVAVSWAY